jgi:Pyruvate/2-oxoacid:ferredoxin oxidoreductase gamma subunit
MLGALFAAADLGIPVKSIKKMIRQQGKQRFVAANLKAFDLGFKEVSGN